MKVRKYAIYFMSLLIVVFLYSCGGGSGQSSLGNASSQVSGGGTRGNVLTFNLNSTNPDDTIAPFPNDLVFETLFSSTRSTSRAVSTSDPSSEEVLMQAVKLLGIEGFSPNSPIVIPMNAKVQLNSSELGKSIKLVNVTGLVNYGIFGINSLDNNTYVEDYLSKISSPIDDSCYKLVYDNASDEASSCFANITQYFCGAGISKTCYNIVSGAESGGELFNPKTHSVEVSPSVFAGVIADQVNITSRISNTYNGNLNSAIVAYPLRPLEPGSTYAVAILKGINNLSFDNTLYNWLMNKVNNLPQSLISQMSATDYQKLQYLRGQYAEVENALKLLGIEKDNMLMMFTFTTADKTLGLEDYPQIQAALGGASLNADNLTKYSYSYDNMTLNSKNVQNNEFTKYVDPLSDLPLACQNLHEDNSTFPQITDNLTSYMLTPNVYELSTIKEIIDKCKGDYPDNQTLQLACECPQIFGTAGLYDNVTVLSEHPNATGGMLMFQHGLWGSKDEINDVDPNTGKSVSQSFSNFQIYAMDLPWHGQRVCKDGYNTKYGCSAMPAPIPTNDNGTPTCNPSKSGSCYLTTNPIYDVLNIYQSLLDMHTFLKFIALQDYKEVLYEIEKGYTPKLLNISFASQSMGSITGSMLLNIDNLTESNFFKAFYNSQITLPSGTVTIGNLLGAYSIPEKLGNFIYKADLNVGGANYASIVNEALFPGIAGMLSKAPFIKYYVTLDMFQWLLDPADPAYLAGNESLKSKIILQNAYNDTLVPNVSNAILANGYGYQPGSYSTVTPSSSAAGQAGWYMFEGEYPYSWINHGFFVHTTISGYSAEAKAHFYIPYIVHAQSIARQQAACFFDNSTCSY